uniref:CHAT domain-containing protein n=1 Tax=Oscillatoriales cyanobacterium SpSt-402 TaxID=2282168 RepID=A0A832H346_9CYAN
MAANPSDTARLRLDQEVRDIDLALRQTEFRHLFEIKQHLAVRVIDLQGYLLRYKPDIVHFSGHGDRSSQIILEDNDGRSRPVPPDALSNLFRELKGYIRLVVLNACYTEQQARAIAQHIECVVGMSGAISDPAAISFAVSFYQALGFGTSIETAFSLGCVEINLESLGEENKPKLLTLNSNSGDIVFALPKDEDLPGESPGSEIKSDLKIKKQKGKLTILDIEGPGTLQKSGARKIDTTTDIEETGEGSITTGIHFGRSGQRNNSSAKDEFGN